VASVTEVFKIDFTSVDEVLCRLNPYYWTSLIFLSNSGCGFKDTVASWLSEFIRLIFLLDKGRDNLA
jgi:hypothetical protein